MNETIISKINFVEDTFEFPALNLNGKNCAVSKHIKLNFVTILIERMENRKMNFVEKVFGYNFDGFFFLFFLTICYENYGAFVKVTFDQRFCVTLLLSSTTLKFKVNCHFKTPRLKLNLKDELC